MSMTRSGALICALCLGWSGTSPASAQTADGTEATRATEADGEANGEAQQQPPSLPWQQGPRALKLGHGVQFDLPDGYDFLAQPEAGQVMTKMGNLYNDDLLGLVTGRGEEPWFITLRYTEEGHVKDDEKVDGDELLKSMREGLPEVNDERKEQGFPPIRLDGWDERPHYDGSAHHLVWCLRVSDKDGSSANYSTRVLGRKGFIAVNLVTDPQRVAVDKPHATAMLQAARFETGARYEDFEAGSDKVAEYGLAGLIAGGAGLGAMKLVKLGLLAKFSKAIIAALIAGKKVIVALLVAAGAGLKRFFGRSKGSTEQA